ncbi:MAG: hypothetical protein EON98_04640, partial [Chitinophagaceae bacterium]
MLLAVLSGFIVAALVPFAGKMLRGRWSFVLTALPLVLFLYFLSFIPALSGNAPRLFSYQWVPSLGINFSFLVDGLSLLFALMITGIGTLVFLYTSAYMKGDAYLDRFYGYLSLFMGAMLGMVLSDSKSAQYPLHFWLPGAMKAPTPVSTYLHSATMVKAGIYLLARFTPVLGNVPSWNNTLLIVGGFTMLYAAFHAIFKKDLKEILAYSTISALGMLVFLLGLGTPEALLAMVVFLIVHALYKATLFLITGIIDHETGTRDVDRLSSLPEGLKDTHMPDWRMWVPPLVLGIAGLMLGLFPGIIDGAIVQPAQSAIYPTAPLLHLKLWHGFNTVLALSAVTIFGGLLLYFLFKPGIPHATLMAK